jgi:acyl-CoA thioesterase-1
MKRTALLVALCLYMCPALVEAASAEAIKIVAFGDSLTYGSGRSRSTGRTGGVPVSEAYPAKLERALRARGWDVSISNRGIPGRTSGQGLAAVDASVPAGTTLTIVQFGLNDYATGIPPSNIAANLIQIINKVRAKGSSVILMHMWYQADEAYFAQAIQSADGYTRWFRGFVVPGTKPFVIRPEYDSGDGEHPNAAFTDIVVGRAVQDVEAILRRRGLKPL